MTLRDLYLKERAKDKMVVTNARQFIQQLMQLTHCTEGTARVWLTGAQMPDALKQDVISKHFGIPADQLFNYKRS